MARPFTDEDAEWIRSHCAEIEGEFSLFFEARAAVFPKWRLLMDRLRGARDTVLTRGWPHRSEIEEGHNEICVAAAILEKPNSLVRSLDYEPKLGGTEKTIDFIAVVQGKAPCFVDVKTIAPKSVDRWEQYQWAHDARLLGDPPMLGLSREGLGGEIWHANVAARERMLEHTLELEEKLSLAGLLEKDMSAVLMLCSNGFDCDEHALEDFVAFYLGGQHRFDDHFSAMGRHYIDTRRLPLPRRLHAFGYLERMTSALRAQKVIWGVTGGSLPPR